MAAITNVHIEAREFFRQLGIEVKRFVFGFDPGRDTLHKVHRARHGPEMHSFRARALLNVGYVTLQSLHEKVPGPLPVGTRQHPGGGHSGKGGAMGGMIHVIGHIARDGFMIERITETAEDLPEFLRRKQVNSIRTSACFGSL